VFSTIATIDDSIQFLTTTLILTQEYIYGNNEYRQAKMIASTGDTMLCGYTVEGSKITLLSVGADDTVEMYIVDDGLFGLGAFFKIPSATPELNEHYFYYDYPYMLGDSIGIFIYHPMNIEGTIQNCGVMCDSSGNTLPITYSVVGSEITLFITEESGESGSLLGVINDGQITIGEAGEHITLSADLSAYDSYCKVDRDNLYIQIGDEYAVGSLALQGGNVESIKLNIQGLPVTRILNGSYLSMRSDKDIYIPEGIEHIESNCFGDMHTPGLHIPSTLKSVSNSNFIEAQIENVYITDLTAWCNIDFANGMSNPSVGHMRPCALYLNEKLLTTLVVPEDVTEIKQYTFYKNITYDSDIHTVILHKDITYIGEYAFSSSSISSITFEGTMSQWNAITKGDGWNYGVPATYVQCSDGQVAI
jgi:hypothetical protein